MFSLRGKNLGIDLGTANSSIMVAGLDNIIPEPTVVAVDNKLEEVIAYGKRAFEMIGRTPDSIEVHEPLKNGVISNFDLTESFIRFLIDKADPGIQLIRGKSAISCPGIITDVERRALEDACIQAGVGSVDTIDETFATALGRGLSVYSPKGSMVVSMGAGVVEAATISLGGVVSIASTKNAGRWIDQGIRDFVREEKELLIGLPMAEEIKNNLSDLSSEPKIEKILVHGRDLRTAMPKTVEIYPKEIENIIFEAIGYTEDIIISALERTPPELSRDIVNEGIFLSGGLSLINGLDKYLEGKIGIRINLSKSPFTDTVFGCSLYLEREYGKQRKDDDFEEKKED